MNSGKFFFSLEQVIDLALHCRKNGFKIDISHCIDACKALNIIYAQKTNNEPVNSHSIYSVLAPLFCSSVEEQHHFHRHIREWLDRYPDFRQHYCSKPTGTKQQESIEYPELHSGKSGMHSKIPQKRKKWARKKTVHSILVLGTALVLVIITTGFLDSHVNYQGAALCGTVYNKQMQVPVENALIRYCQHRTTSDSAGGFKFDSLADTIASLQVLFPGYAIVDTVVKSDSKVLIFIRKDSSIAPEPTQNTDANFNQVVRAINTLSDSVSNESDSNSKNKIELHHNNNRVITKTLILLTIFTFFYLIISRFIRKRMLLSRQTASGTPDFQNYTVRNTTKIIFQNKYIRKVLHLYGKQREAGRIDLDVEKTIYATIANNGFFQPVYSELTVTPQYLVLIDRRSGTDQFARYIEDVIQYMKEQRIELDVFYFNTTPLLLKSENGTRRKRTLSSIYSHYPTHRLLVFSNGQGLINPVTGKPFTWVNHAFPWQSKVLFIPNKLEDASKFKEIFEHYGFKVKPLTVKGLEENIMSQNECNKFKEDQWDTAHTYPPTITTQMEKCLSGVVPDRKFRDTLINQLNEYLGEDGMLVLGACAVYPELHYELTIYLCINLVAAYTTATDDETSWGIQEFVSNLTQLPWFENMFIPNWLRLDLLSNIPGKKHRYIKAIISRLLKDGSAGVTTSNKDEKNTLKFTIAQSTSVNRLATIENDARNQLRKSDLKLSKDYIFADYMVSTVPRLLRFAMPKKMQQALCKKGTALLGIRDVTLFVICCCICTGLFLSPLLRKEQPIQKPSAIPEKIFQHESDTIVNAVFLRGEKWLLTTGNHQVRLWEIVNGQKLGESTIFKYSVKGAHYLKKYNELVTWCSDNTLRILDGTTYSYIGSDMRHNGAILGVVFSAGEDKILSWGSDTTVKIWDAVTGQQIGSSLKYNAIIQGAAFSVNEDKILSWSNDGTVRMWNTTTGQETGFSMKHNSSVLGAKFSADGNKILSWSSDGTVRMWNAATGQETGFSMKHNGAVLDAKFSADEKKILSWSSDGMVRVWEATTGKQTNISMKHDNPVQGAVFSADENKILSWDNNAIVRLWDAVTSEPILVLKVDAKLKGVSFSENETNILTWGNDGTARIWKVKNNKSPVPKLVLMDSSQAISEMDVAEYYRQFIWYTGRKPIAEFDEHSFRKEFETKKALLDTTYFPWLYKTIQSAVDLGDQYVMIDTNIVSGNDTTGEIPYLLLKKMNQEYLLDIYTYKVPLDRHYEIINTLRKYRYVIEDDNPLNKSRPQWLAGRSTIFYYNEKNRRQATRLKNILDSATGESFDVKMGGNSTVSVGMSNKKFIVHVIKENLQEKNTDSVEASQRSAIDGRNEYNKDSSQYTALNPYDDDTATIYISKKVQEYARKIDSIAKDVATIINSNNYLKNSDVYQQFIKNIKDWDSNKGKDTFYLRDWLNYYLYIADSLSLRIHKINNTFKEQLPRIEWNIGLPTTRLLYKNGTSVVDGVQITDKKRKTNAIIGMYDDIYTEEKGSKTIKSTFQESKSDADKMSAFEANQMELVINSFTSVLDQLVWDLKTQEWGKCLYLDGFFPRFLINFYYLYEITYNNKRSFSKKALIPEYLYDVSLNSTKSDQRIMLWKDTNDYLNKLIICTGQLKYQLILYKETMRENTFTYDESETNGETLAKSFELFVKTYFNQ